MPADERLEFALEGTGGTRELVAATHKVAGDAHPDGLSQPGEAPSEGVEPLEAPEGARREVRELRVEVVQMPAQPVLQARRLGDEVLAVVEQELDLERGAAERGLGQVGPAQRGARDRLGVDGVGLAVGAGRAPLAGHELGRDAHDALAAAEQEALEPARAP